MAILATMGNPQISSLIGEINYYCVMFEIYKHINNVERIRFLCLLVITSDKWMVVVQLLGASYS